MNASPERGAIVSGIGISRIGRRLGVPGNELTEESARAAISDAGLSPSDIDGMDTVGDTAPEDLATALGIDVRWDGGGVTTGGLFSPIMSACLAVAEGRARHVLIYRTVQMLGGSTLPSNRPPTSSRLASDSGLVASMGDMSPLMTYHAYSAANWLAMHCRRHMHLYGTTKEQLGALAVNSRRNAGLNPLAAYRDPLTLDDYMTARPISDPFGLYDCDVPVDGSISVVISDAAYAAGCPSPVQVEAMGGGTGKGVPGWVDRPDYPKMASIDASAELWSRTDLTPADVDLAELYDGFSFLTLAWIEALGLCGEGESGPFVADPTQISLEGRLPVNTYGGQLSAGRMHGYWVLHEACLQLRGQAGERQVPKADVAVVAAGGGPIAGCFLLSRR